MPKLTLLMLFSLLGFTNNLFAQTRTATEIVKIAKQDARKFKLEKPLLKEWRKTKNHSSDYFKPNANTTANKELLTDSTYVHKFRDLTHEKTSLRLSTGRWLLIAGASIVGAATFVVVIINSVSPK